MTSYSLPPFGELNPGAIEARYDAEIDLGGRKVKLDLNFESRKISPKRLETVKAFLDRLPQMAASNLKSIQRDFTEGGSVRLYLEHHVEELPELIDRKKKRSAPERQLLSKLHLVRVGMYPEGEESFATFDYSIGQDLTQYLVVVSTDEKGELIDSIAMES